MQLFLQRITEHHRERLVSKCVHGWNFASALSILKVGKGCEVRCLLFSFAR